MNKTNNRSTSSIAFSSKSRTFCRDAGNLRNDTENVDALPTGNGEHEVVSVQPSNGKSGKSKQKVRSRLPRVPKATRLDLGKLIDEFLIAETVVTNNKKKRRITHYEAIMHQLWLRTISENKKARAQKVLLKYMQRGASRGGRRVYLQFGPKPESASDEAI